MCDADVDGSHIRTLILTFFYRQMPEIIKRGYLYIAQPPLYKVSHGKSETYLKDDREYQVFLVDRIKDAWELDISHGDGKGNERRRRPADRRRGSLLPGEDRRSSGRTWTSSSRAAIRRTHQGRAAQRRQGQVVAHRSGEKIEQIAHVIEASGFHGVRSAGRGPRHALRPLPVEARRRRARGAHRLEPGHRAPSTAPWRTTSALDASRHQLHPRQGRRSTSTRRWRRRSKALRRRQEGLSIQRYKGLGEMNPTQLWETTMDPTKRRLLRVQVEDDVDADSIFTILMGDEVEPRRAFIQNNALEVRNLDV